MALARREPNERAVFYERRGDDVVGQVQGVSVLCGGVPDYGTHERASLIEMALLWSRLAERAVAVEKESDEVT